MTYFFIHLFTIAISSCTHTRPSKENENRNQMDLKVKTSNNERLESACDNHRRSKRFCSNAVLCVSFTCQMVKTRVIRLRGVEGRNARDQSAFCAFDSFLVEV